MLKRERKRRKKIKKISETAPDSPLHYQRTNDLTVTIFYLEYYFLQLWLRPKHCIYNAQLLIFLVEKSQKRKKEERKKEWKIIIIIIIKLRDTTTFLGSLSTALSVSFISESLSRSFQSRFTIHDRELWDQIIRKHICILQFMIAPNFIIIMIIIIIIISRGGLFQNKILWSSRRKQSQQGRIALFKSKLPVSLFSFFYFW